MTTCSLECRPACPDKVFCAYFWCRHESLSHHLVLPRQRSGDEWDEYRATWVVNIAGRFLLYSCSLKHRTCSLCLILRIWKVVSYSTPNERHIFSDGLSGLVKNLFQAALLKFISSVLQIFVHDPTIKTWSAWLHKYSNESTKIPFPPVFLCVARNGTQGSVILGFTFTQVNGTCHIENNVILCHLTCLLPDHARIEISMARPKPHR